ncbi:oligosaccharide flippase family protein [Planctomycetota bacterium]
MLGRRIALVFYSKILRQAIGLTAIMFTSRLLGPEVMGVTSYAASFIGMVWFLAEFGMEITHIKLIHETGDLRKCVGTLATLKSLFSIIAGTAVITGVILYNISGGFSHPKQSVVILLWLAGNIVSNFSTIATYTFLARKEVAKSEVVEIVQIATHLLMVVAIAFAMTNNRLQAPVALAVSYILANLVSAAVAAYLFRGYGFAKADWPLIKRYLAFAAPFALISAFSAVVLYIDKVTIGTFYQASEVGIYHGATRLNRILLFISGAAMTVVLPTLMQHLKRKDMIAVRELMHKAERYLSLIVTLMVILMVACAPALVLLVLGEQFLDSVIILQIITIVALMSTFGRPVAALIVSMGKPKVYALQLAFSLLLTLAANIVLVPKEIWGIKMLGLGGFGAALGSAAISVISLLIGKFIVWKISGIPPYWGVFKHLISGGVTILLLLFAQNYFQYTCWVAVPINVFGGTTCYLGLLFILREFSFQDIRYIYENIRLRSVKEYGISELKQSGTPGDEEEDGDKPEGEIDFDNFNTRDSDPNKFSD